MCGCVDRLGGADEIMLGIYLQTDRDPARQASGEIQR